ncbi:MAG: hypothetical protein AVDCRST_MAG77-4942 [uncultured Chloroflexi bacterium]|uniref:NrS-1 polymerase-like HBD domain-containing protein n=1 Tax=uncultured Chloroflexota bacterium TaxID=166587 RepID=A0A6J4K1Q2_9CHLR|nr:MAG: hypothetical protein AVDCRST_MAG77-4942 [uncultured Chloroflexota bacterium]
MQVAPQTRSWPAAPATPPPATLPYPTDAAKLPAEFRNLSHFVGWEWAWREGKWTKPPVNPHTGTHGDCSDPGTWGTFNDAVQAAQHRRLPGIGIELTDDMGIVGGDLDKCRDPQTGTIAPWAMAVVRRLNTYTQVSPTGTGLRFFLKGKLPGSRRRTGAIEVYSSGRYLTLTTERVPGVSARIEERQAELDAWYAEVFPAAPAASGPTSTAAPVSLDDAALLSRARSAKNGAAFAALWEGDTTAHGGDDSAADLALCSHLAFWTGRDMARIDSLFRRSGLYQDKWDGRRGVTTYGQQTIQKAIAGTTETYSGPSLPVDTSGTPDTEPAAAPAFGAFTRLSAASPGPSTDLADAIATVPALPTAALLTPEDVQAAAAARAVWLDPYITAASRLSPRTPRTLHEAAAITALNTAIARRAYVQAGARRLYPALLMMFVGRSTLFSKTGGLDVFKLLMREAGLLDLLLPASFTPQALLSDLALHVPTAVRDGSAQDQTRWLERHRHGAQRAIVRDELAGLLDDCNRDYNAGLLPLLLKLDGAPDDIDADMTVSRGLVEVREVCMSLLGATTPAALRSHAAKSYHWANGLFGRFNLIAPDGAPHYSFWSEDETALPTEVVAGIKRVYRAFSTPTAEFEYAEAGGDPEKGQDKPRIVGARQTGYAALQVRLTRDAWKAWKRYDAAMFSLTGRPEASERLDATYGRLPSAAIRVALALAAAEWALVGKDAG